jgi:hypothetical protein
MKENFEKGNDGSINFESLQNLVKKNRFISLKNRNMKQGLIFISQNTQLFHLNSI